MSMKSVSFGDCFGWLHQTTGASLGVVMCASWDYEALATLPTWRVFADRLADAGLPTLRFDYPGTGDSLGEPSFEASVAAIVAAAAFLRVTAGVERVALVGLRLGATLALQAASATTIEALALIRPVTRGRAFLAEQRALAKIIAAREGAQIRRESAPGAIVIEGFDLTAPECERIGAIDLAGADFRAPERALIAGEPGSKQYLGLRDRLLSLGARVTELPLTQVPAWGPAPVPPAPPLIDADAIAAWLIEGETQRMARPAPEDEGLKSKTFAETAITFGGEGELRGLLCRPQRSSFDRERRVVLFLNTGANSHIGSGRSFVEHARALAGEGVASLRMDCLGLGDAGWLPEGPLGAIHRAERAADVSAAIDRLKRDGLGEVTLVGVCSGAFLAFQAALADPRVKRLLLVNPSFWTPPTAETLADPLAGAYGSTSGYLAKALDPLVWRRLFTGDLAPAALIGIARALGRRAVDRLRGVAPTTDGSLLERVARLERRGCATTLLLSEGDAAHETLASELAGRSRADLEDLMRVVDVTGADHAFVLPWTREALRAQLRALLEGRQSVSAPTRRRRAA